MADLHLADLARVDRDAARAFTGVEAGAADPFAAVRYVAGQSTYEALGELATSAQDVPLRDALREWVYALTQTRIAGDLDAAWRAAAEERAGRFDGDEPRLVSYRESWRGVVTARNAAEASRWLDAAADTAPKLAAIARERATRGAEVARRMGVADPRVKLVPAARALLDATEDVAREMNKASVRRVGDPPAAILVDAVGRDAPEGWPARLSSRWLDATVGGLSRGLRVSPVLPAATLGAASFARALYAFGFALRVASARASGLPFAIARAPGNEAEHRHGFLLASLATDAEFHRRALDLGRAAAAAQARVLARVALLDARLHAARLLLTEPARFAPVDLFDELSARLFAAPLSGAFAGAFPRARDDEPSRFAALLAALPMRLEITSRHDVDWWRNPRAGAELRGRAERPARTPEESAADPVESARLLARALEEANA